MRKLNNLPRYLSLTLGLIATAGTTQPTPSLCRSESAGILVLHTPLKVNPDGSTGSYAPGDHGYTYINNGLNLVENGQTIYCHAAENNALCRQRFSQAEANGFGPGSPTFCVYAMEVVPFRAGIEPPPCDARHPDRKLIGDGKGKLRIGPALATITGGTSPTYASMTSVRHIVNGQRVYLDSAALPVLVTPRRELLGAVAWLRLGRRSTFAILGDSGGSFGEGSIALHQRLLYDEPQPPQPLGPIPVAARCGPLERSIRAPFQSRPNRGDHCRSGYTPYSVADIRGYTNIDDWVDIVVLTNVKPEMRDRLVRTEVTPELLAGLAHAGGYSRERLNALASCPGRRLRQSD